MVLLVDSRHKPTEDDVLMIDWIIYHGYPIQVIATKADKLSRNEISKNKNIIKETLKIKDEELTFFSSTKKEGREELINKLFDNLSEANSSEAVEN